MALLPAAGTTFTPGQLATLCSLQGYAVSWPSCISDYSEEEEIIGEDVSNQTVDDCCVMMTIQAGDNDSIFLIVSVVFDSW